jgi:hypothetical protein
MYSQQKNVDRLAVQHVHYVRSADQMLGNAALEESRFLSFSFHENTHNNSISNFPPQEHPW